MSYDIPSCVLLHLDGAPVSTIFPDTGVYRTSFVGYNAAISNSQTLFGGNVLALNGSNGFLLSTKTDSLSNSDFTLEAWVFLLALPTSTSTWPSDAANHSTIISLTGNSWYDCGLIINSTDIFFADNIAGTSYARGLHGLSTGTWYHLACSRSGGVINTYVNGSIVGTSNISSSMQDTQSINIGAGHQSTYSLSAPTALLYGFMSEARYIKGYGVYTVAFTPSSTVRFTDFALNVDMLPIGYSSQSIGSQGSGSTNNNVILSVPFGKNIYHGGSGIIVGQTIENSSPVSRRVRLFNKRNGLLIKEVFSDNLGVYTFEYIDKRQEYFIMADDYRRIRNAVVMDGVVPIPASYADPNSDV
jgi:hypothetical protein